MQALIITAYKNEDMLIQLLERTHEYFRVYLHIDKKSSIRIDRIKRQFPDIYCSNKYEVYYAGFTHLLAVLHLLEQAVKDRNTYCHIISGQDILTKPCYAFDRFEDDDTIYLDFILEKYWDGLTKDRLKYWLITSDYKGSDMIVRAGNKCIKVMQDIFGIERRTYKTIDTVYKGLIWASLPLYAAEYVLSYIRKHPEFITEIVA